jgi:hypothetical protein
MTALTKLAKKAKLSEHHPYVDSAGTVDLALVAALLMETGRRLQEDVIARVDEGRGLTACRYVPPPEWLLMLPTIEQCRAQVAAMPDFDWWKTATPEWAWG